jgi:hypothetical protein
MNDKQYDAVVNGFTTKLLNPFDVPVEEFELLLHKRAGEPHMQYPHTAANVGNLIAEVVLRLLNNEPVKDTIQADVTEQVLKRSKFRNRLRKLGLMVKVLTQIGSNEKEAMSSSKEKK